MTSSTNFRLSMKELTATRNMRLVVALYLTFRTRASSSEDSGAGTTENSRLTSWESSGSTWRALSADVASLKVGSGISRVLYQNNNELARVLL